MNEHIDAHTGEVTTDSPRMIERAADGVALVPTAETAGNFLDLLEDGDFSREAYAQLKDLGATMHDIGRATGQKVKGKVTIVIDLARDGEAFTMQGKVTVKKPEIPRPRSIMWTDENNNFTRFPPNQTQLFGAPRNIRSV